MEILVSILVVISKNSIQSVLLLTLLSIVISLKLILNGIIFLGLILTIVYGGAIVILIVFVLYMLDMNKLDIKISINKENITILWLTLILLLLTQDNNELITWLTSGTTDIEIIGENNYSNNGLLLIIVSMLLLLSLTCSIYLLVKSSNLKEK